MPVRSEQSTRPLDARERDILQPPRYPPWLGALPEALLLFVLISGLVAIGYGLVSGVGVAMLGRFSRERASGLSVDEAGVESGLAPIVGDSVGMGIALLCVVVPLVLAVRHYLRSVAARQELLQQVAESEVLVIEVENGRSAAFDHVLADGTREHLYVVELQDGDSLLLVDLLLPDDPHWHGDEDDVAGEEALAARERAEATGDWAGWRPGFPNSHFVLETVDLEFFPDQLELRGQPQEPQRITAPNALLCAHAEALVQTRQASRIIDEPFDALVRPSTEA